jgi:hypothetical protein
MLPPIVRYHYSFPRRLWEPEISSCRRRGGGLTRPPQRRQEINQGVHLGRRHLLAEGRHVAAARRAVADLVDQLIARHALTDPREFGTALAAESLQSVTVAALLIFL